MTTPFWLLTVLFILVSLAMVLIILVQRPQGGGLAGAFGGAGAGGTESVFGGRTGDALTLATVAAFLLYMGIAIALNVMDNQPAAAPAANTTSVAPAPTGAPIESPQESGDSDPVDGESGSDSDEADSEPPAPGSDAPGTDESGGTE